MAVGLLVAVAEATLGSRDDIALLIAATSALLGVAVIAIRLEIESQVGELSAERASIENIPDARWRVDAELEVEQTRLKFASWASGVRRVPEPSSLNYQIESLRSASQRIDAIHLALDSSSLKMWTDQQRGFWQLVAAFKDLPPDLPKRRVMVLNKDDHAVCQTVNGRRTIVDPLVRDVCVFQAGDRSVGGLGFDLRIRWTTPSDRRIGDLLLIDGRESCAIESFGHGKFGDLEVCVSPSTLDHQQRAFEDLWTNSAPFEQYMPSSDEIPEPRPEPTAASPASPPGG